MQTSSASSHAVPSALQLLVCASRATADDLILFMRHMSVATSSQPPLFAAAGRRMGGGSRGVECCVDRGGRGLAPRGGTPGCRLLNAEVVTF